MGGVKGRTGKYVRTPEMLANYRSAAKKRSSTSEYRAMIAERMRKANLSNKHALGCHWKWSTESLAKRKLRPGNHTGHKHSEETKVQISESKHEFSRLNSDYVKEYTIKGAIAARLSTQFGYSSLEKTLYHFLDLCQFQYNKQYQLDGGKFFLDAYIPSANLAIEVDGVYWHSREKAKIRDAEKEKLVYKLGMNLLRIPERSIKDLSFTDILLDKIDSILDIKEHSHE